MGNNRNYLQMNYRDGGLAFATMMCLYVFMIFIGQSIIGAFAQSGSTLYIALCSLLPAMVITIIVVYYAKCKRFNPAELTGVKKIHPLHTLFALLLVVGMFFGFGFINNLFQVFLEGMGFVFKNDMKIDSVVDVVVYVITLALVPAVFEEIFFRGMLLCSLSRAKRVYAIIISALCFSLYHAKVTQLIYQFIFGVGLAILALTAKSIIPCIIAHFINNFTIILLEYFKVGIDFYNALIIMGGLLVLSVFAYLCTTVLLKRKQQQTEQGVFKKFFLPFGIFGIFICLLLLTTNLIAV